MGPKIKQKELIKLIKIFELNQLFMFMHHICHQKCPNYVYNIYINIHIIYINIYIYNEEFYNSTKNNEFERNCKVL